MNLYRALYHSKAGKIRRMTFAAITDQRAVETAAAWELADDALVAVSPVRALQPGFKLEPFALGGM